MQGKEVKLYQCFSLFRLINKRTFTHLLALTLVLLLGACLPSGEQDVNTELFKDKNEMTAKSGQLKPGMTKAAAFEALGVPAARFERLSTADLQACVYGNSQVQGTPEQLEQFRKRLANFEAYSLPYREIKSSSSLGFGKMKVERTGYDLRLILVFDKNTLVRSSVEGTQQVRQMEDKYMWDNLISRGIGAAF